MRVFVGPPSQSDEPLEREVPLHVRIATVATVLPHSPVIQRRDRPEARTMVSSTASNCRDGFPI